MPTDRNYVLTDVPADAESTRLALLEKTYDPGTIDRLDCLGVAPGARCLEIGAGRGSIARWLSGQVGSRGRVVAADIDCRFLNDLPGNVEVRDLDVRHDELEPAAYDLVHCRALLMHVPDPASALRRMAGALRPGGLLLVEEGDLGLYAYGGHTDAHWGTELSHRVFEALASAKIMHSYLGRTLPGMLADSGLGLMGGEVDTLVTRFGDPVFDLWRLSWDALAAAAVPAGIITDGDCVRMRGLTDSPSTVLTAVSLVSAWARRPA